MKVSNEVIKILDEGLCEENRFIIVGQLDRKQYTAVNKALNAAGGKWNRSAGAHVFSCDAVDAISDIVLTGQVADARRDFDFFKTPDEVVQMMLDRADIQDGNYVLEPNAGDGAISSKIVTAAANLKVEVAEIRPDACEQLEKDDIYAEVHRGDFLTVSSAEYYDRILMNPPFGKQADIKHVMHAYNFLKYGGVLVAIMSAGVTFRENALTRQFREMVEANGGTIEKLPPNSFKSSGTSVETVIVTVKKGG